MMSNKAVFISVMIILLVALILPACSPAATPAATPAAKPPAPAVTTPPASPPTTPPAATPAAPAAKALSFEADTYANTELGITWQYPKKWIATDPYRNLVVKKLSSSVQGSDSAAIMVVPETSDFAKTFKTEFEADPELAALKVIVALDPVKTTTLADGKTTAMEVTGTAKIMGIYDLYAYAIGFNKGGKTIIAYGATLGGKAKKDLMAEMSQTLAVK